MLEQSYREVGGGKGRSEACFRQVSTACSVE